MSFSYQASVNLITIQHKDGTNADYKVFKNNSALVREGQDVKVGQPLALATGANYSGGAHCRVSIYYLTVKPDVRTQATTWASIQSISPKFITEETSGGQVIQVGNPYTAVLNTDLITQDMTKREKKKYLKGNKYNLGRIPSQETRLKTVIVAKNNINKFFIVEYIVYVKIIFFERYKSQIVCIFKFQNKS